MGIERLAFGVESRYILYKNMDASDGLRDNAWSLVELTSLLNPACILLQPLQAACHSMSKVSRTSCSNDYERLMSG